MLKDSQDVDITKVKVKVELDKQVIIEKPKAINSPVIKIERNVLKWESIENAVGYVIFVDGEQFGEQQSQ